LIASRRHHHALVWRCTQPRLDDHDATSLRVWDAVLANAFLLTRTLNWW
jgi:hypothetical protein